MNNIFTNMHLNIKYSYAIIIVFLLILSCKDQSAIDESLFLLKNGKIWTGNKAAPWASWILIDNDRIVKIGNNNNPVPTADQVLDLAGRLTLPGFNDSHVHFESAGALLLGINLLDVNDEEGLVREMKAATGRLPK